MSIREILQAPDPRLELRCEPVDLVAHAGPARRVAGDLLDTMRKYKSCAGLSAPQVGVLLRVVAVSGRVGFPFSILVNPRILAWWGAKVTEDEGCMSVRMGARDAYVPVKRHSNVRVHFVDRADQEHVVNVGGLAARVIQHEVDHLDGVLIPYRVAA